MNILGQLYPSCTQVPSKPTHIPNKLYQFLRAKLIANSTPVSLKIHYSTSIIIISHICYVKLSLKL